MSKNFQHRKEGQPALRYTLGTYFTQVMKNVLRGRTNCAQLIQKPRHLLNDDIHWDHTSADAIISFTSDQNRSIFAILISTCFPSSPHNLQNKYKNNMAVQILYKIRCTTGNPEFKIFAGIHIEVLISIEDLCLMMSSNLHELGTAHNRPMHDAFNRQFRSERQYESFMIFYIPLEKKSAYYIMYQAELVNW